MPRRRPPKPPEALSPDVQVMYDALNTQPDYVCALICASFMDEALGSLLASRMVAGRVSGELLGGALGSFGVRAHVAYSLGLIPKRLYENLRKIGQIRNDLAHAYVAGSFQDPKARKLCMGLHLPRVERGFSVGFAPGQRASEPWRKHPRARFTYVVSMMANRLILTALDPQHPSQDGVGREWQEVPAG